MIGILPTLADGHMTVDEPERQPALPAAQRADPRRPRRGHHDRDRRTATRAAAHHGRLDRARRRPAPAPSSTCRPRRTSSRSTGTPRRRSPPSSSRWARTRRTCSARSCGARPGSRCSSRRPTPAARSSRRRACGRGCGSASGGSPRSSTCSRRTSATSRRCCRSPTTRTRSRCSRTAARPQLAELRLHNGTIYRWNRPVYDVAGGRPAPAGREPGAGRRARPSSTRSPTPRSTSGWSAALAESERPLWSQMSFSAAEENFHVAAAAGHRRPDLLARDRPGARHRAGAAPAAAAGPRGPGGLGRRPAEARPAARHHRAALPDRHQRRGVVRRPDGASAATWTATTRCARRCWSTASACTPTSPCTPGTDDAGPQAASRIHSRPAPLRGSSQPSPGDDDQRQRAAGLGVRGPAADEPGRVDVLQVELAGAGQPDQRPSPAPRAPARSASRRRRRCAGRGRAPRRRATTQLARSRAADVQQRRVHPAPLAAAWSTHRRGAARRCSGDRVVEQPGTRPVLGRSTRPGARPPQAAAARRDSVRVPVVTGSPGCSSEEELDGDRRRGLRAQAGG